MTQHRTVIAQFCDDVRQEIGNKFSLMGCYGTDLYVPVVSRSRCRNSASSCTCARRASSRSSG